MAALRNRLTNFLISGKYRAYRFSTSPFRAREGMGIDDATEVHAITPLLYRTYN